MKGLTIVVCFFCVIGIACAQSLRAQLDASGAAIRKLMMTKDSKGFKSYMKGAVTPDFRYVDEGRTMNFDQMCAGMAMGFASMKKMLKADSKVVTLHEKGNKATALISHTLEATSLGPDHKTHIMAFGGTSADTYVKQGGKWKMSKMAWVRQTMATDGKPMNGMSARPSKRD